jgi:hypothetical protein
VLTFVGGLAALLLLSGLALRGLYSLYEHREDKAYQSETLPLADLDRNPAPRAPQLEGIDPNQDVGRAWPSAAPAGGPMPWFGFNVRVVPPPGPNTTDEDAEERARQVALAMGRKLQGIDRKLADMAGKLPVRPGAKGLPTDVIRRSAGEGDAGRSAAEKPQ